MIQVVLQLTNPVTSMINRKSSLKKRPQTAHKLCRLDIAIRTLHIFDYYPPAPALSTPLSRQFHTHHLFNVFFLYIDCEPQLPPTCARLDGRCPSEKQWLTLSLNQSQTWSPQTPTRIASLFPLPARVYREPTKGEWTDGEGHGDEEALLAAGPTTSCT